MSSFANFVEDFPSRCGDLLVRFHQDAVANDREVTLALMVASAGFLVPFERLRPDGLYIQPTHDRHELLASWAIPQEDVVEALEKAA